MCSLCPSCIALECTVVGNCISNTITDVGILRLMGVKACPDLCRYGALHLFQMLIDIRTCLFQEFWKPLVDRLPMDKMLYAKWGFDCIV